MEILTLKGIGKSKLLTRLLKQCPPENCLIVLYKKKDLFANMNWIPENYFFTEVDSFDLMEKDITQYIQKMKQLKYELIDYIVIYSNVETEKDMIKDGVYRRLESLFKKMYNYNYPTCIVACKE